MIKRLTWQEDAVLSLRLREDLYSLVQMRRNQLLQFFAVSKSTNTWTGTDLNAEPTLCFRFVAENKLKPLFVEKLKPEHVIPSRLPIERRMLNPVFGNDGEHGANLVELTPEYEVIGARIIKAGLTIADDLDLIYAFELAGMLGDAEKLRRRLIRYFDSGINWDEAKPFLFKDIAPPPPHWQAPASLPA